jgi:hypothetical protein
MGSLSNLYISESYQSLIHLGSDNTASVDLIELQDGEGNSIGVAVNTAGDLFLSGSLTASLQEGYLYVGDGNGKTIAVATSSIVTDIDTGSLVTTSSFNEYTQSNDDKVNSLINATGSYVTSAITASSLITASFSGNTLTFTKGDASTFGIVIPDISGSTIDTGSLVTTQSFNEYTASNDAIVNALVGATGSYITDISALNAFTQSADGRLGNLESATASYVTETESGSFLITASFDNGTRDLTFTKGDNTTFAVTIPDISGSTIDTGSFATTGSNTFTGDQTLTDSEGNSFTIADGSGSLMLVGKGFTSASAHLLMSASAGGNTDLVNLIFKSNNNTAQTIISGSNNIIVNPVATVPGLRRQLGSSNFSLSPFGVPGVSASMDFPIIINGNTINNIVNLRGPVSASSWNINNNTFQGALQVGLAPAASHARGLDANFIFSSNILNGSVSIVANESSIKGTGFQFENAVQLSSNFLNNATFNIRQSGLAFLSNFGGGFTVNNDFFSGSQGFGLCNLFRNQLQGSGNIINFSGSIDSGVVLNQAQPDFNDNIVNGINNIIRLDPTGRGGNHSIVSHGIIGSNLIVTGSTNRTSAQRGGMHIGRFNAVDGNRALTTETVFAVGTGTSNTNRKTGFLIDSGSNIFMEGAVNISGSLLVNGVAPGGVDTGSFATTGSNTFTGVNTFNQRISVQGINVYSASNQTIYIGDRNNFNPATTGVPSEFSHTVVGIGALSNFGLGDRNTVYGRAALKDLITGSDNFALGAFAGEQLKVGDTNFFIGTGAAPNLIVGEANLFIGNAVANQFRSGSGNVFIGQSMTGFQFVSGSGNLIFGRYGDKVLDNVDNQFSVTYGKLDAGKINLFYKSGSQNDNLFLYGGLEVQGAITASQVSASIVRADRLQSQGEINIYTGSALGIYIGDRTNFAPTSAGTLPADSHVVIGQRALENFGNGDRNLAIGRAALKSLISGSDNLAIGLSAGDGLIEGNENNFFGSFAGSQLASGNNNFYLGQSAGNLHRSGSSNVFIGINTGGNLLTGSGNLIIGRAGGTNVANNVDDQVSITYGDTSLKRLLYKSGSEADNAYLYGGLQVQNSLTASAGLINGNLTIQSGSGDLFVHGNKQFNVGEFTSLVTQSGSAGVSQSVNLDVTNISQGVSVQSNSQITLANSGTYSITFSAQVLASGGQDTFWMWLKKNGVNVSNSATKLIAKNGEESVMTVEYIVEADANDYYEIVYQNLSGNARLLYEAASGNIPATPSIIVSVKQCR